MTPQQHAQIQTLQREVMRLETEVESLRAERERLHAALERIAATEPDFGFIDDWQAAYSGALVIARAALAVEFAPE